MEGKLKTQDKNESTNKSEPQDHGLLEAVFQTGEPMGMQVGMQQSMPGISDDSIPTNDSIMLPGTNIPLTTTLDPEYTPQTDLQLDERFSWEMIGLGLEEPMPTQEAVDELYDLFPLTLRHANKTKEHRPISIRYIPLYR